MHEVRYVFPLRPYLCLDLLEGLQLQLVPKKVKINIAPISASLHMKLRV